MTPLPLNLLVAGAQLSGAAAESSEVSATSGAGEWQAADSGAFAKLLGGTGRGCAGRRARGQRPCEAPRCPRQAVPRRRPCWPVLESGGARAMASLCVLSGLDAAAAAAAAVVAPLEAPAVHAPPAPAPALTLRLGVRGDDVFLSSSSTDVANHFNGSGAIIDPGLPDNITAYICSRLCKPPEDPPSSFPSVLLEGGNRSTGSGAPAPDSAPEERRIILVMSHDNVLALLILSGLSVLGAIYLWKICTRRQCSCRICRNQYRTLNLLGSGGYGSVYLVERIDTGANFVSKKIPIREITEADEYAREAKDLIQLRHRHIVSYEDDFVHVEYGTFEPKTYFIIIMEYCPEGDLKEKIESDFDSFTEEWVRTIFAQILQAVQYLHSKNVIHRDLKSQNVFLAANGLVRLGDFGLCRRARGGGAGSVGSLTHAGTDCYMAPEMLSSSRYGPPADMWSMGCVLYELLTGQFMWELEGILGAMVMKDTKAAEKLVQANIMPTIGKELSSLLRRLLNRNAAARPTATQCMRKKLFKRSFTLSRVPFGDTVEACGSDVERSRSISAEACSDENEALEGVPLGPSFGSVETQSDDQSSSEDETPGPLEGDRSVTSEQSLRRKKRRRRTAKAACRRLP